MRGAARSAARRRPSRRVIRRRRAVVLGLLAAVVLALVLALSSGGGPGQPVVAPAHAATRAPKKVVRTVRVRTTLLSWRLPNAISREALFPAGRHAVLVAGGLVGGNSQTAVDKLDLQNGALSTAGQLATATHDAAALALRKGKVVVGGGTVAPATEVQTLRAGATATLSATLAQPRSDATGAVLGGVGYVVGGYDGPTLDSAVLATRNGKSFRSVAQLAVPVRYGAVAPLGRALYVFGGTTLGGAPLTTIQRVDLATHRSTVVGHLPVALAGADAGTIGGRIYVAGGRSASGDSTTVYAYSPNKRGVTLVAHLPVAVAYGAGIALGNRLYLVGGEDSAGNPITTAEVVTATAR